MTFPAKAYLPLAMLLVLLLLAAPVAAAGVDAAAVNDSVAKAKAYLYAQQKPDGTWEDVPAPQSPGDTAKGIAAQDTDVGQWGGRTSLVVYALLAAGESPAEPKLAKAVQFVKTAQITGTYAVGVRMLALSYLPTDAAVKAAAGAEAELLLKTVKTKDDASGHYDYNVLIRDTPTTYSHSRSQYGTLGMWAAAKMGYQVPPGYWQLVDAGWRRNQRQAGGWGYYVTTDARFGTETLGMTVAGVASLFITGDALNADRAKGAGGCNGNVVDPNVEGGLRWIAEHFEDFAPDNEYDRDWKYPTLYGLERVGAASGLRSIGGNDWYARGVGWLLPEQRKDGSFTGAGKSGGTQTRGVIDTSFALLFLGRGRSPVMAAKLAHAPAGADVRGPKADWNQRPRDLANLALYTGQGAEKELHWQIVGDDRTADEWLDAPVLYLSGSDALDLSGEVKAKLRDYAEKGGLILLNADCGRPGFGASALKLGGELFPAYEFRVLEQTSPIYSMQYPLDKARRAPRAMALGNGARELMVLVDKQDLGRDWQTRGDETALQFGANLYLYAVDRDGQRYKGQTYLVAPDAAKKPTRTASVGRVKYNGNWDPEPYGWQRLTAVMHNDYDTALTVKAVDPAADDLAGLDLLHLTGTGDFKLAPPARQKLKAFVEAGGTLLADAAGGSTAFAAAAERELRAVFGDAANALTQAAGDLPLYGDMKDAPPLKIAYRLAAARAVGAADGPMLRAIPVAGRAGAVLLSNQDLSVGLVGMPVAGVVGYTPDSATNLVARAVRASLVK